MKLTKTDRCILESYAAMLDGLADYLGSAYEISLHSLEDYHHAVIRIMNGYHSGRTEGAPLTDLALNMLKRIEDGTLAESNSYTSYNAVNATGEHLKSSTIPIFGENHRLIGILCINLYLDSPLSEILQSLTKTNHETTERETFSSSMPDIVREAVADARNQVIMNPSISSVNKNKELIRILHEKGIFNIKDSVLLVAETLGISRNTVYMHLRNLEE